MEKQGTRKIENFIGSVSENNTINEEKVVLANYNFFIHALLLGN